MGKLSSNGQCILINPNGVFFGKDSRVDMQSLIASTFDLHNDLFKGAQENWRFEGVGEDVFVYGTIKAKKSVFLLGKKVGLFDHSSIEVPSGTVLIGGDYQGKSSKIPNAEMVYLSPSSIISVDALEVGDGGTIILWAEELNQAYGTLSARGGMLGGDGGLIEISSPRYLDFQGLANTSALFGKTGTLLFDPLDLTIAAANVNVMGPPPPFALAFPTGAGAILSGANVTTSLTSNNVTIRTTGTVGPNPGNIIIDSTITLGTANNTLTINAAGGITVNRLITSAVAGTNVTLLALDGDINVNGAAATAGIRNTASPGANLSVIAENGNINLTAGASAARLAVIGTNNGDVYVSARRGANPAAGNIALVAGSTLAPSLGAIIGSPGTGPAPAVRTGNITVEAAGNITITAGTGSLSQTAGIGKVFPIDGVAAGATVTTNISVTAGENISLICGNLASSTSVIGLLQAGNYLYTGDITVNAGRDLNFFTNGNVDMIGTFSSSPAGHTAITNIRLNVGGNLKIASLVGITGGTSFIGTRATFGTLSGATSVTANIGGNIYFDMRSCLTGFFSPTYDAVARPINPTCFVNALGDFYILGSSHGNSNLFPAGFATNLIDLARTDFTFHIWIGGSIRTFNNLAATNIALLPSEAGNLGGGPSNTSMRAGGDIVIASSLVSSSTLATASFGAPSFNGYFVEADSCFNSGELWTAQVAIVNGANVFAGTPVGIDSPAIGCDGVGAIAVDTNRYNLSPLFAPYNGNVAPLTVVVGPPVPHIFTTAFQNVILHSGDTYTAATSTFYTMPSPANIIIGNTANQRNVIDINTTSGNIEIGGSDGPSFNGRSLGNLVACGCLSSFHNISINTGTANPWTSGSIYVSANNNIDVNVQVSSSGLGSPITLIADFDNSGVGNLNINTSITTNNGDICLAAGAGAFRCGTALSNCAPGVLPIGSSSIFLNAGQVSSGSGSIAMSAYRDIFITGATPSLLSTSGTIALTALSGNISISRNIISTTGDIFLFAGNNTFFNGPLVMSTAGEIRAISGVNMELIGATVITSTASPITLVVDGNFPNRPLMGAGAFIMSSTSTITSGVNQPLRIFTSQQFYNTISGSLNMTSFSNGTLFEDTAREMWCSYFACPFPYPFTSLGSPFTIFYKNCLQEATQQAMIIIDAELVNLHPYNEFPGWIQAFTTSDGRDSEPEFDMEHFFIRRRHLHAINHPKTWTVLSP